MFGDATDATVPKGTTTLHYCECGGPIQNVEGLEGSFCTKCGKHFEEEAPPIDTSKVFDLERLKAVKGCPTTDIVIGSETKGRIKMSIPYFASKEEAKAMIDQNLELLLYTKKQIEDKRIDIFTTRGKKDDQ